jgi:hypothetical protein
MRRGGREKQMIVGNKDYMVDSVNIDTLAKDIREHSLAGPCQDSIEELMAACACFLYGTKTNKKIVVGLDWTDKKYEKQLS